LPQFWLIAVLKTPRLSVHDRVRKHALRHSEWRSSLKWRLEEAHVRNSGELF
jgi:hypothetical protein